MLFLFKAFIKELHDLHEDWLMTPNSDKLPGPVLVCDTTNLSCPFSSFVSADLFSHGINSIHQKTSTSSAYLLLFDWFLILLLPSRE